MRAVTVIGDRLAQTDPDFLELLDVLNGTTWTGPDMPLDVALTLYEAHTADGSTW